MFTRVKTADELIAQRESGRMLAAVLDYLETLVKPGVPERFIADEAERELKKLGGASAFKNYPGQPGYQKFPDVICVSTNKAVVHGIATSYELTEGDIISLDFGVIYRGMVTDSARTFAVGKIDQKTQQLVDVTKRSLEAGIASLHDGVMVGDIAAAVEAVIKPSGFGIVRELVGHGVGHQMHEAPDIPNYGRAGTGPKLKAGMTIAIEPMVTMGSEAILIESDGWTISTRDGQKAAHFEHTILITDNGAEILT